MSYLNMKKYSVILVLFGWYSHQTMSADVPRYNDFLIKLWQSLQWQIDYYDHAIILTSPVASSWLNYVLGDITPACLAYVDATYGSTYPFAVFVDEAITPSHDFLANYRFCPDDLCPEMVLERCRYQEQPISDDIEIVHITHENIELLDVWGALYTQIWSIMPCDVPTLFFKPVFALPPSYFFLGYYKGEPAAFALAYAMEEALVIFHIGTKQEFRNKGLGFAMTQHCLLHVPSATSYALLEATPMGEPIYIKMGFKEVGRVQLFARA
jgi:ribosomal protein S18 acetylase RimI-like enzyme